MFLGGILLDGLLLYGIVTHHKYFSNRLHLTLDNSTPHILLSDIEHVLDKTVHAHL